MTSLHKNLQLSEVHAPVSFRYADESERLAAGGFTAGDLYKIAYQSDDGTFWSLVQVSSPVWVELGGGGGGSAPIRRDLDATGVENIVVGAIDAVRKVTVEYVLELPLSGRSLEGTMVIIQDGTTVTKSNGYSFTEPEIETVNMTADIIGNDLIWTIQTIGLSENPVLTYKKATIPVA